MNLIRETFTDKKQESKKLNIAAVGEEDAQKRQRVKKKRQEHAKEKHIKRQKNATKRTISKRVKNNDTKSINY